MKYAKAITSALGSVITVLTAALADDVLSLGETSTLIATLITAAGTVYAVWRVPNTKEM